MDHDSELASRLQGTMLMGSSSPTGGDPLTTHPLLSPTPSTNDIHQPHSSAAVPSPPRYVPYTPRQRIASATTSTTLSSSIAATTSASSSLHAHGGATGKLQLQSLKASVQTMGLDNNSVGWAIIEKLVSGDAEGQDWDAIWQIISAGQVALLLPTEKASVGLIVTPEFVRDHVAFCNVPVKDLTSLVTLGGLRGVIDEHTITFRTALPTQSDTFLAIQRISSRSNTLASLAPLSNGCDPNTPYPTYHVSDHQASLHIPPRPVPTQPPPLPPRPAAPATPTASTGHSLSGRFASLFGGGSRSNTSTPAPAPVASPSSPIINNPLTLPPRPNSPQPPPSIRSEASIESTHSGSGNPYAADGHFVTAFAIDRKIIRKDVSKGVTKALKADIKIRLGASLANSTSLIPPLPSWIVERILSFAAPLQPLAKKSSGSDVHGMSGSSPSSPLTPKNFTSSTASASNIVVDLSSAQDMAMSFQDFYDAVEDELRKDKTWSGQTPRRRSMDELKGEKNPKETDEKTSSLTRSGEDLDEAVREAMDLLEGCITSVFYDQLFVPQASDDASHDEALANRIAALNMLDLGWEHLGVEMDASTPETTKGIDDVVANCGRELQKLQDIAYRSPQAKAGLLVAVHRMIVDGLSHLPPVRLKPDGEQVEHHGVAAPHSDAKTPRQESFGANVKHHDAPTSPLHSFVDSPLHTESPQGLLTPDSGSSALPKIRSTIPPLGSPRAKQSSLRSLSPGPSINSSPRPLSLSLALPEAEPTSSVSAAPGEGLPESNKLSGGEPKKTAVNTDVLLPIIIFSVVKANPVQLVSQLLFIQRYRSRHVGGEESFCLINFLAVVEFLEHVDMQALGLGDADRVMSTQDLTPLPLSTSNVPSSPTSASASARLRGRVEQQVGELATGATKVISGVGGVVDSSFSALRGLLNVIPDPAANDDGRNTNSPAAVVSAIITRPGFGLLRRGTSFSIAGVAASLPGGGGSSSAPSRDKKGLEQGQQMVEVPSRPGSVRRFPVDGEEDNASDGSPDNSSDDDGDSTSDGGNYTNGEADQDDDHREGSIFRDKSDTRSIRSFSSMMSRDRDDDREREKERRDRPSLTDRLANMPALSRFGGNTSTGTPPGSRRTSLLPPPRQDGPSSSIPIERIAPPNHHFLHASSDELRLSEIPALLADYKRVVEALRNMGGFQE